MGKIYLFAALVFVGFFSKAQPTLNADINPAIGDQFTSYVIYDNTILMTEVEPSGSDHTWDFSAASLTGADQTQSFVNPTNTPYANDFSSSSVASEDKNGNYSYYKTRAQDLALEGLYLADLSLKAKYTNKATLYTFPFTYNSSVNDNFSGNVHLSNGVPGTCTGTSTTLGDGYGTLMLPWGTFTNLLRVKLTQTATYSVGVSPFISNTYIELVSYSWFSEGLKQPLLTITTVHVYGDLLTEDINNTEVSVSPLVLGTHENPELSSSIQLYPNPSEKASTLSFTLEEFSNVSIELLNPLGQKAKIIYEGKMNPGQYQEEINIEDLPSGLYTIRILADNAFSQKKLLVK